MDATASNEHARYDDLNTPLIAIVGVVSAVLVFASIVAVQALYYRLSAGEEYRKRTAVATASADDILNQQRAQLHSYGWIDRSQGQVAIPIERAMELVLMEYRDEPLTRRDDGRATTLR